MEEGETRGWEDSQGGMFKLHRSLWPQNLGKSMSCQEFVTNLNGLQDGGNFPKELLKVRLPHTTQALALLCLSRPILNTSGNGSFRSQEGFTPLKSDECYCPCLVLPWN